MLGPPDLGQAARHHRHGPDRPGGRAPRQGVRHVDPLPQPPPGAGGEEEALEATYWDSLDQMLARMDVVSVHCPHTPATFHLLSARRLKLMKKEAYVVNTARGEVIDETP
jgi:phosphoglycerate dehydrogenase-like enzyme